LGSDLGYWVLAYAKIVIASAAFTTAPRLDLGECCMGLSGQSRDSGGGLREPSRIDHGGCNGQPILIMGMPSGSPGARRDPIRSPSPPALGASFQRPYWILPITRDNFPKDHEQRLECYKELTPFTPVTKPLDTL
jgi:hypothetical protein